MHLNKIQANLAWDLGVGISNVVVSIVDDAIANFGTDNDLKIRHISSTNQNRIESTTGSLMINQLGNGSSISILATNVYLKNHNNNETYLHAVNNGAVSLYYDNNVKFATSNAGASVTGTLTATTFSGSVSGTASGNAVLTGSTNNTVTTVTGANAIQGEANLTFDGDTLLLKSSTDGRRISFAGDGTSHYMKYDNTLGGIILNGYGGIAFETNGTNERLRIDSGGRIGIGANNNDS